MKSKKTPTAQGMLDGEAGGVTDGKAAEIAMDGSGGDGQGSLQMKSEIVADGEDPNDRGMPGVRQRGQQQDMPQSNMEEGRAGLSGAMPAGGMGKGAVDGGGRRGIDGGSGGGGGGPDGAGGAGAGVPRMRSCGTMDVHRRLLSADPAYARARDQIEDDARRYETGVASTQRTGVTRIPVIVHVVWNTPAQNISDAQIASQIDVLNRDFRRTNADFGTTPAAYLPLATDAAIEFYLATTTPGGAPTGERSRSSKRARIGYVCVVGRV